MIKILLYILSLLFTGSSVAVVLDWSGSYKLEEEFIQNVDQGGWQFHILHNLRLEPDLKVLDGLSVQSGFQLASPPNVYADRSDVEFYYQNGSYFGWNYGDTTAKATVPEVGVSTTGATTPIATTNSLFSSDTPPGLEVRHLYLKFAHNFGVFQTGWKPHHFGMGMYYNDGSNIFSPVYNKQGSRGFVSWKGFFGSYYVRPMVHYIDQLWFNAFIQGGFKKDQYGIEAIYKMNPVGLGEKQVEWDTQWPAYLGIYAYYKTTTFSVQAEGGQNGSVRGGAFQLDWYTPWKRLRTKLGLGFSSTNQTEIFYFDPSFSSALSFVIERYEGFKTNQPEYLKKYLFYSFHSAFYAMPAVVFSLIDSLDIKTTFSIHFSYPDWSVLLYGTDLVLSYQLPAGVKWLNRIGVLFPSADDWHIGVNSGVAITF